MALQSAATVAMSSTRLLAMVFASPADADGVPAGGLTVLDRQLRLARRAGAVRIVVVGPPGSDTGRDTIAVADAAAIAHLTADADVVLLIAAGLVCDERIVAALVAAPVPAIGVWAASAGYRGVERIDAAQVAAGIAVYPAAMVRAVAAALGDWDFASTLLRTALADGATRVDLAALGAPVAVLVTDADAARAASRDLVAAAARPGHGWPAQTLYPSIERRAVALLLPLPVTAAMLRAGILALAVAAAAAFAAEWRGVGLALALACAPLDGIAARLARVRLDIIPRDRVPDGAIDLCWALAIAVGFAATPGAWAVAALLIGMGTAERLQRAVFHRLTGGTLDRAGDIERRLDLVSARRDVLVLTWLPFALAGAWYAGFAAVAVHATASFFAVQWRSVARLSAR